MIYFLLMLFFMPINVDKIHWVIVDMSFLTQKVKYNILHSFGNLVLALKRLYHKILLIIDIFAHLTLK